MFQNIASLCIAKYTFNLLNGTVFKTCTHDSSCGKNSSRTRRPKQHNPLTMKAIIDYNYVSWGACLSFAKTHMENEGLGKRLSYSNDLKDKGKVETEKCILQSVFEESYWSATVV